VSCGQFTDDEKALGRAVCELIERETPYLAYFAEQQSTFDGLINNIFAALGRSSALVAIMHQRGDIDTPVGRITRGSVWVEQEIAIGAFVHHVLKRPLQVGLYVKRGIALEGARQQLMLNPTLFDTADDVLADLSRRLSSWNLITAGRKSLIGQWRWLHRLPPKEDRHEYTLVVELVNNGFDMIDQWKAEIWFPSEYINRGDKNREFEYQCDTDTNYTPEYRRIWPGDEPRPTFAINYFVDAGNWPNRPRWPNGRSERSVRIKISGGDHAWERDIPMRDLQEF
jgi:hypothetical protein